MIMSAVRTYANHLEDDGTLTAALVAKLRSLGRYLSSRVRQGDAGKGFAEHFTEMRGL
jgi:hypothetical protein